MNAAQWLVLRKKREKEAKRRLNAKTQARCEKQIACFNEVISVGDDEVHVPKDIMDGTVQPDKEALEPAVSAMLTERGFKVSFIRDTHDGET